MIKEAGWQSDALLLSPSLESDALCAPKLPQFLLEVGCKLFLSRRRTLRRSLHVLSLSRVPGCDIGCGCPLRWLGQS